MGLAYKIHKDIPIYIGETSYKIIKASDGYKCEETFSPAGFLEHRMPIEIGDLKITPFLIDHSAFDSYMILVEANGESILYTGDFRSNGRKPFKWLLSELPNKVDFLICEGTTLSREKYVSKTEKELENEVVKLISDIDAPVFILQSSMNIDRLVTMYRATKKCKRIFLEDLYLAEITNAIGGSIPNPNGFLDVKAFIAKAYPKEHSRYRLFSKYGANKISKAQIERSKFVMCVRVSMLNYIKSLSKKMQLEGGLLIYSFWSGYREQLAMKEFLKECENLGLKIVTEHTSGHADADTIKRLIEHTNPLKIIPVHTENVEWFIKEYGDRVKC